MAERRGVFVYERGERWPRICLTVTGARVLAWRLNRAERAEKRRQDRDGEAIVRAGH